MNLNGLFRKRKEAAIRECLTANPEIEAIVSRLDKGSDSTGVSPGDYVTLWEFVRLRKPRYFLECGTGKSTHVIAAAMLKFCKPIYGDDMGLVSMESVEKWADLNRGLVAPDIAEAGFLNIVYEPVEIYGYSFVRGTVYRSVPDHPYEAVFTDGPSSATEATGRMCNMDFVRVVENSERSVAAVVDNRKTTLLACTMIFGKNKVRFHPEWNLGTVDPVSRADMKLRDDSAYVKKMFFETVSAVNDHPADFFK